MRISIVSFRQALGGVLLMLALLSGSTAAMAVEQTVANQSTPITTLFGEKLITIINWSAAAPVRWTRRSSHWVPAVTTPRSNPWSQ